MFNIKKNSISLIITLTYTVGSFKKKLFTATSLLALNLSLKMCQAPKRVIKAWIMHPMISKLFLYVNSL